MVRSSDFQTTDIELAAALMTCGQRPEMIAPGAELVEFHFPNNDKVREIAVQYAAGTLCLEVRKLANSRSWLYRQVREISRSGQGVNHGQN